MDLTYLFLILKESYTNTLKGHYFYYICNQYNKMSTKTENKSLKCQECGIYFKTTRTLRKHLNTKKHIKNKDFRFPKKIIPIPNADKKFHESWKPNDDELDFPHPFRCILSGPVNVGKTTLIKNIIIRQKPFFEELFVIHCDAEYTKEYEDVEAELLTEIPSPSDWQGLKKTLVILDDVEYQKLSKEQQSNLDRLFGFCSTHKNISVIATCQDFFRLFPSAKRMSNIFVIWKSNDMDSFKMISRKCGLKQEQFLNIFESFTERRDSLWIDLTDKSPFPLRKNGYEILNKNDFN